MKFKKYFLIVFCLVATGISHLALASRGLYFSASKMTSSQKNIISNYNQGTVVDIQMSKLSQSNTVDNDALSGKSFDFTKDDTAGAGYLSYDKLKSALDSKYMQGEVTFKVKTQAADKLVETYTAKKDASVTLNNANATISSDIGTAGTAGTAPLVSTMTTKPTTGNSLTYTISTDDKVSTPQTTTTSSIIAPDYDTSNYCIYDKATRTQACAPVNYITFVYGEQRTIPITDLFDKIKEHEGAKVPTTINRDGVSVKVHQVPYNPIKTAATKTTSEVYYEQVLYEPKKNTQIELVEPTDNVIQTKTDNATISFKLKEGDKFTITDNEFETKQAVTKIEITGKTTTTANNICLESNISGKCDVEYVVDNIQNLQQGEYLEWSNTDTIPTLFVKQIDNKYYPATPSLGLPKLAYLQSGNRQVLQSSLKTQIVDDFETSNTSLATNGTSTFTNGKITNATSTSTPDIDNSDFTYDAVRKGDSGIDLYSELSSVTKFTTSTYSSMIQNLRIVPEKIGANMTVGEVDSILGLFDGGQEGDQPSSLTSNAKNAIQYIDGDEILRGNQAYQKITKELEASTTNVKGTQTSFVSVYDLGYTADASKNFSLETSQACFGNDCGYTDLLDANSFKVWWETVWNVGSANNADLVIENLTDLINNTMAASKAANIASMQVNYQKDSSGKYLLDGDDQKVKHDLYDITLREKNWSFEIERAKEFVKVDLAKQNLTPQFNTSSLMQNFVSSLAGQASSGAELSVGYKFRLFKSSFYTAPQLDISLFRNSKSTISGKRDGTNYTYGNIDSSYAGSLVAKLGFENKFVVGSTNIPFSIYGFGGGTSSVMQYRDTSSQSFGLKYGFGAEVFVSKNMAIFGEMFQINLLKQNIDYSSTNTYKGDNQSNRAAQYIRSQRGTTVTLDNAQYGQDTKNLSIKYADLNQVIDAQNITYKTTEKFENTGSIQGVKLGLTYYVE